MADVTGLIRGRGIHCSIRGSGAGCLVNYLIGISGIDPLEYDLLMERFLSESRRGLPDIDLDVESARRIEAYRAIVDAYSEQRIACVSMMETYRARSAIRDVAASLGLPPHEIDMVAKAFPHIRAGHIRSALAELPELRGSGLAIPQLTGLFRLAERLDGLPRHVAMHPCGVVLSDASLLDRTPVERSFEGLPLSQFDKDDVETAGMIKLDVLGVRMQSAMAYTVAEVERTRGERVDIDAVGCADEPTFEMIRSARTLGCFQIESPGQRELVGKLLPRDIGDLIVDISLFRPGPVNSDMVTPYLDIRHGRRAPGLPARGPGRHARRDRRGGHLPRAGAAHHPRHDRLRAVVGRTDPPPAVRRRSPGRKRGSGSGRPRSTAATTPPPRRGSGRCSRRSAGSASARRTRRRSPSRPTSRPG